MEENDSNSSDLDSVDDDIFRSVEAFSSEDEDDAGFVFTFDADQTEEVKTKLNSP